MKKIIEIINIKGSYTGKLDYFQLEKLVSLGFLPFGIEGGKYTIYRDMETFNKGGF